MTTSPTLFNYSVNSSDINFSFQAPEGSWELWSNSEWFNSCSRSPEQNPAWGNQPWLKSKQHRANAAANWWIRSATVTDYFYIYTRAHKRQKSSKPPHPSDRPLVHWHTRNTCRRVSLCNITMDFTVSQTQTGRKCARVRFSGFDSCWHVDEAASGRLYLNTCAGFLPEPAGAARHMGERTGRVRAEEVTWTHSSHTSRPMMPRAEKRVLDCVFCF